jgi:F420H(2)-dependent quinone reductase
MLLPGKYAPSTSGWARRQAESYEATGGARAGDLRGMPVVLTSVAAKTGLLRKTALMRVEHVVQYAVSGSLGGGPKHPEWVHNVRKNPHVELQDGPDKADYTPHEADGTEREEWWETNEDLASLRPAVVRPGRCLAGHRPLPVMPSSGHSG